MASYIAHIKQLSDFNQNYLFYTFCGPPSFAGGLAPLLPYGGWVVKCIGVQHVLWIMWMAHPNQADRPQGTHHVSGEFLVANDLGKAQAGNRAGKTRHDLQWWDTEPE